MDLKILSKFPTGLDSLADALKYLEESGLGRGCFKEDRTHLLSRNDERMVTGNVYFLVSDLSVDFGYYIPINIDDGVFCLFLDNKFKRFSLKYFQTHYPKEKITSFGFNIFSDKFKEVVST